MHKAAIAWACTPGQHTMSVTPMAGNPAVPHVLPATAITVTGVCDSSGTPACVDSSNHNLFQDTDVSYQNKSVQGEHQTPCTTGDTNIGAVSFIGVTTGSSGNGTVASGIPGPHIICASIAPDLLWGDFVLL